jgi:hypothetical protein
VYAGCWRLGATAEQIAEHLVRIEREAMGYDQATIRDLLPIARRLQAVDLRLDTEGKGKR